MSLFTEASLVMIPSGVKDGKLYSIKPDDGVGDFTFTRGSNLAATRVDENGLIEKGRENLLLQSNNFTTTWTASNVTPTSGQTGYDGSNDAWLLSKSAISLASINQTTTATGVITFSAYVKAGTLSTVGIRLQGTPDRNFEVNLSDGTIIGGSSSGWIYRKVDLITNGWYRCSFTIDNSGSVIAHIYAGGINETTSGNIYIQDAQLELGLVATDYIETGATTEQAGILENLPRLDYTDSSCPSLLLEPTRTNLVTQSEYFGSSDWTKNTSGTGTLPIVSTNYALSPEGLSNSSRLILDKGAGTTSSDFSNILFANATSGTFTFSVYLKSNTGTTYRVLQRLGAEYNSIDVTSEWQRFVFTQTTASSGVALWLRGGEDCDDYADILVYGFQLEAAPYPTSYIPTYGTSVTRSYDACSVFNAQTLIGQTSGTLFIDFILEDNSNQCRIFSVSGTSWITNGSIRLETVTTTQRKFRWNWASGGTATAATTSTSEAVFGQRYKMAIKYSADSASWFLNGVKESTVAVTPPTPMNQVNLNELGGGFVDSNEYKRNIFNKVLLFTTELTDSELEALTTI